MANEEVIGPRKTMIVLVIVVGCFAVLWPRILSPMVMGRARDELKPNKLDREAGCCEVLFESEVAYLEIVNEVCNSAIGTSGNLSPLSAAECRKSVNATCGVDIAAFLKRSENVGKTTKMLLDIMKSTNSSCLRENFGVPIWSVSAHVPVNFWKIKEDKVKQERPLRSAPHPALRERGRAIPAGAPPSRGIVHPPHVRPPPIPGMRPPLGAGSGPAPVPKTSMNIFMPIYTICIIVFFVYTLSKILFKRTGGTTAYEQVSPDPQFRRRVFRDDSRTTPDTKLVVSAISGLVAEVQQEMETSRVPQQKAQDAQAEPARPYTNGTLNNTPRIIATEYKDTPKIDEEPEHIEEAPKPTITEQIKEASKPTIPEPYDTKDELKSIDIEDKLEPKVVNNKETGESIDADELTVKNDESIGKVDTNNQIETLDKDLLEIYANNTKIDNLVKEMTPFEDKNALDTKFEELFNITNCHNNSDNKNASTDLIESEKEVKIVSTSDLEGIKQSTPELLAEALKEESAEEEQEEEEDEEEDDDCDQEIDMEFDLDKPTVKVLGMESTAHPADGGAWPRAEPRADQLPRKPLPVAEEIQQIFLETDIPQQSRVLVTDFVDRTDVDKLERTDGERHSPLVVSGKMTLSLIQDPPRATPERELESTAEDFTTASAMTQPAAAQEKEESSEEEIDIEEIEDEEMGEEVVEELEEQVEEEEVEVGFGGFPVHDCSRTI